MRGCAMGDIGMTEAPTEERVGIVVIHGVGETEPGWINRSICDPLAEEASSLKLVSHSELHSLPDAGNVESGSNFNVLLRRARMGTRSIVFAELFWADLS